MKCTRKPDDILPAFRTAPNNRREKYSRTPYPRLNHGYGWFLSYATIRLWRDFGRDFGQNGGREFKIQPGVGGGKVFDYVYRTPPPIRWAIFSVCRVWQLRMAVHPPSQQCERTSPLHPPFRIFVTLHFCRGPYILCIYI